jgi:competence protein ComEC
MTLWRILLFTLGILAVIALPALPPAGWLMALTIPALLPWRYRAHYAMALLGVLLTVWRSQLLLDQRWPEARYGEEVWMQGHIASLPDLTRKEAATDDDKTDAAASNTWRFQFEPAEAGLPRRVRAAWYRTEQIIKGGECWRLQLRLKPPHGSLNPGGFDYEGWLFRQGIAATGTVRAAERCEDHSGYPLLKARQAIVDRFSEWLPESPARGLFIALTLGDTSELSSADWDVFRVTGTTHLVAISGFNIAIVSGIAFFVFRWLWCLWPPLLLRLPAQKAAMLGATLFAFAYALLAGWEPPVQRAFLMLAFVSAASWSGRLDRPSRVLALAWLIVLLLDPLAVLSPGLWLSFGAVAAIFYVMMNRLQPHRLVTGLVLLQLMLSVVLAPLTVYYFHGVSWFAPLLNLLAVPLFSLITPVLLFAILLAVIAPALGLPLMLWCAQALSWLRDALGWLAANLPHAWLPAAAPTAALLLALIGSLLLFAPRGLPLRLLAVLCFLPLLFVPDRAPKDGFELTALDVGQGLAVVVRTAHHTLLYDTGAAFDEGFDAGAAIVAPYLLDQGVRRLDLLLISHADNDHAGGAGAVRRLLTVDDEVGALTPTPCRDGQHWDWDGVSFEMLHPTDAPWSRNNGGCVLRVEAGSYAALLPADVEKGAERRLLQDKLTSLQADVLLAPHHGSRSSSTEEFIDAVQPQIVIHSAGWHSQFHHPHPSVVTRYREAGARQWVTGLQGAISLQVTERGVSEPTAWREQARHFWQMPAESLPP